MNAQQRLLLADDDQALSELLQQYLQREGYRVDCVSRGDAVADTLAGKAYDLLILDIMMPGRQGLDVLQDLRHGEIHTPVIMLTARGDDTDRIVGLELGADDYLPKPCNPRELSARIKAVLRRPQHKTSSESIKIGHLHIDQARHQVSYQNELLNLTQTEFDLILSLARAGDRLLSKNELSLRVLNRPLEVYDRSIDMHISNLRKKLQKAGAQQSIETVRGVGYRLLTGELQ